jgi:hypothetical protein
MKLPAQFLGEFKSAFGGGGLGGLACVGVWGFGFGFWVLELSNLMCFEGKPFFDGAAPGPIDVSMCVTCDV